MVCRLYLNKEVIKNNNPPPMTWQFILIFDWDEWKRRVLKTGDCGGGKVNKTYNMP